MRKGWLIAMVAVLLAAGGGGAGAAYYYGKDDRLPAGFAVGGLSLGGLPAALALERVQNRIAAIENTEVRAAAPGSGAGLPVRTLKQLGLEVKADAGFQALEIYRNHGWWERAKLRFKGESAAVYDLQVGWDEAVLGREIREAWGSAAGKQPINAKREINDLDEVVYTPEIVGTKVDVASLAAKVKNLAPSSLAENSDSGTQTVKLQIVETAPEVTLASLKEEGIERKIAEFTTSFATSAAGRSHNVTVVAKALNDTLLQPAEVFQYGTIVDTADKKYGYKKAPVILKGKLVPGVGGGICQVSSTLYNTILQAGLDVVERRNHSITVHYLPPGLDATFADGFVNFRFRNSTGKQLLIRTVVRDKHLTVKLFGTLPKNVSYRTETEQLKVIPPQTKYVGNAGIVLGQQKRLQKGENGYVVDTFRIKFVDGKQVAREKMPRSNYKPQDELIAVHPDDPRLKPQDTTPPPSGQDGPVEPV